MLKKSARLLPSMASPQVSIVEHLGVLAGASEDVVAPAAWFLSVFGAGGADWGCPFRLDAVASVVP